MAGDHDRVGTAFTAREVCTGCATRRVNPRNDGQIGQFALQRWQGGSRSVSWMSLTVICGSCTVCALICEYLTPLRLRKDNL